ncbi:NUDIX domain-containing protein [Pseudoroseomonas cervicalis]|uniref:GDP-mannose pyrophosphatase n=1 Tax=Pseudoroseomonas cervicalis ATCC 49957 TaxID=525371 RepID=D5RIJ7_9PROT|nr:NUDIX hydrolase [Pseudoroseomonas cervicalis]EFH12880.1 hydrolase, NUDIX family [Pseudoroseomonas cervicalis ATCC 49957]
MQNEVVTLSSRVAYENRWLRVREDRIRRADGSDGLYGVVERSDFVVLLPWQDGCLTLVEQYRYPVRARQWELPMGTWEQAPGTDPAVLAAAELREETGLTAARLEPIGTILQGPGYCSQRGHVFLATGLTQGPTSREASEQDMLCRALPLAEVEAMARDGVLQDACSLAALALARLKGVFAP